MVLAYEKKLIYSIIDGQKVSPVSTFYHGKPYSIRQFAYGTSEIID